ncbi:hypothetical protein D3C72_1941930 [compost metagenome]
MGNGTRNWISKIQNSTALMPIPTSRARHHADLPIATMKPTMKIEDATYTPSTPISPTYTVNGSRITQTCFSCCQVAKDLRSPPRNACQATARLQTRMMAPTRSGK